MSHDLTIVREELQPLTLEIMRSSDPDVQQIFVIFAAILGTIEEPMDDGDRARLRTLAACALQVCLQGLRPDDDDAIH